MAGGEWERKKITPAKSTKTGAPNTRRKPQIKRSNSTRNTTPRRAHCHRCKRQVISAIYDAQPRKFDPQPLSPTGEVLALLSNRRTWFVANGHLYKRNAWAITTSPRGLGGQILVEHDCRLLQPSGTSVAWPPIPSDDPGF